MISESTLSAFVRNAEYVEATLAGLASVLLEPASTGFCVTLSCVIGMLTALVASPMTCVFMSCAVTFRCHLPVKVGTRSPVISDPQSKRSNGWASHAWAC